MNPPNSDIAETPQSPFERVKQVDEEDNEFWFACDLIPLVTTQGVANGPKDLTGDVKSR